MTMLSTVQHEFRKLEKQIAHDNRKLEALRLVINEYATDEHPGNARLNSIIMECLRQHNGAATFQHIVECIGDHQITLPKNKLSLVLTNNKELEYDKASKLWKIVLDK